MEIIQDHPWDGPTNSVIDLVGLEMQICPIDDHLTMGICSNINIIDILTNLITGIK